MSRASYGDFWCPRRRFNLEPVGLRGVVWRRCVSRMLNRKLFFFASASARSPTSSLSFLFLLFFFLFLLFKLFSFQRGSIGCSLRVVSESSAAVYAGFFPHISILETMNSFLLLSSCLSDSPYYTVAYFRLNQIMGSSYRLDALPAIAIAIRPEQKVRQHSENLRWSHRCRL